MADVTLNEVAFKEAQRYFNRTRSSMLGCLRSAIRAYKNEERKQFASAFGGRELSVSLADTDDGVDTALVITGFKNLGEIDMFVASQLHA